MAKELFLNGSDDDERIILIADVTYLYCQKSSINDFQARSYSQHKKRHYMKYLVVCSTNGYIVQVYDLQEAILNDAAIFSAILNKKDALENDNLRDLLLPNDLVILDRGFRDCLSLLKKTFQLNPKTPSSNDFSILKIPFYSSFILKMSLLNKNSLQQNKQMTVGLLQNVVGLLKVLLDI
jgi:hypothetical protein